MIILDGGLVLSSVELSRRFQRCCSAQVVQMFWTVRRNRMLMLGNHTLLSGETFNKLTARFVQSVSWGGDTRYHAILALIQKQNATF